MSTPALAPAAVNQPVTQPRAVLLLGLPAEVRTRQSSATAAESGWVGGGKAHLLSESEFPLSTASANSVTRQSDELREDRCVSPAEWGKAPVLESRRMRPSSQLPLWRRFGGAGACIAWAQQRPERRGWGGSFSESPTPFLVSLACQSCLSCPRTGYAFHPRLPSSLQSPSLSFLL